MGQSKPSADQGLVEYAVDRVLDETNTDTKILVLTRQDGREDSFPIWIGAAEGAALGVVGAVLGTVAAIGAAWLVNGMGMTWTPPGRLDDAPRQAVGHQDRSGDERTGHQDEEQPGPRHAAPQHHGGEGHRAAQFVPVTFGFVF